MNKSINKLECGRNNKNNKDDIVLYIIVIAIVLFGIVMVYSSSYYGAEKLYDDKFHYVKKQIFGALLGFVAMFVLARIDYHILQKLKLPILFISIGLLVLVLIPGIGVEKYGARRWINLPFFTLQASELSKFGFIIFCGSYMAKNHKKMTTFLGILPILVVGGIICVLIMLEPNMSITICVVLLMLSMLFVGGARIKHFILLGIPLAALLPLLIILEPYRLDRLMAFLNPWASPLDEGFQLIQSFFALGSGGLTGLGLFNSRQKFLFLPFSESDFIFAIIGEELGLIGASLVIIVFVLLIVRAARIAQNSNDRLGCYFASGIASIIAIQVLVNVAVVTGSIPPTGLPLPFISAGSSSLVLFCASIGILQSIKRGSHISIESLGAK